MPELPEVQTVVNDLRKMIIGKKIAGFYTDFPKSIKSKSFKNKILGEKIISVERVSKNIVIKLSSQKNILAHLKMTGKLVFRKNFSNKKNLLEEKHVHNAFLFDDNSLLEFNDVRKFGTLQIISDNELNEKISIIGIDPFSKNFTVKKISEILKRRSSKKIKALLMDQKEFSGIGNIYASEILFDAKISPKRLSGNIKKEEIQKIKISALKILRKSISLRGTSFSDYRDGYDKKGSFQNHLNVYKRSGQKCKVCDTIIDKLIIEQRSTFFCPNCQK